MWTELPTHFRECSYLSGTTHGSRLQPHAKKALPFRERRTTVCKPWPFTHNRRVLPMIGALALVSAATASISEKVRACHLTGLRPFSPSLSKLLISNTRRDDLAAQRGKFAHRSS